MKSGKGYFLKRLSGLLFIVFLGVVTVISVFDSARGGDRFLLRKGEPVTVSLETAGARKGWTPVRVDVQGLVLSFWTDDDGRVFEKAEGASTYPLFRLDLARGEIRTAARALSGEFVERSEERTRLRFEGLSGALVLDIPGNKATLDLKGLIIPVSILFGPEADGVRELGIGDRPDPSGRCLCLDTRKKQLFWGRSGFAGRGEGASRQVWAVN